MNVGTGKTEQYNSVLEITVSYLGIHKRKLDIYIIFSFNPSIAVFSNVVEKDIAKPLGEA